MSVRTGPHAQDVQQGIARPKGSNAMPVLHDPARSPAIGRVPGKGTKIEKK
jgi:hypothetical protein